MTVSTDVFLQNESFPKWVTYLHDLGDPPFEVSVPTSENLLGELTIPEEDWESIVDSVPSREREPEMRWFLERCVHALVKHMGQVDGPHQFMPLIDINDPIYRFFYVHVFLATHEHVVAFHMSRGIPKDVSIATLADLGRNVRVHRKRYGIGGLGTAFWHLLHFRGAIYDLGRLQVERSRLGSSLAENISSTGVPAHEGDLALSLHIPDFSGPLTPEACDASIERAKVFFATHFPEEHYAAAVCHSWLLDPQLREYLSESSNIIKFQDRFALGDREHDVDRSIVQFVFGPTPADIDELPQRSSLERAIVGHLKTGRHWKGRSGWFRL